MQRLEAILFDLDGVLVNTIPILRKSYFDLSVQLDSPPPTTEKLDNAIRMSPQTALQFLFHDNSPQVTSAFDRQWKRNLYNIRAFPGIFRMLADLSTANITICTVTSRNSSDTSVCLQSSGLNKFMSAIITWGHYRVAKPSPACLQVASKRLDKPFDKLVYVGDHRYDIEAAKKVGVLAIGAIWDPYADEYELRSAGADIIVKEPHEIVKLAKDG